MHTNYVLSYCKWVNCKQYVLLSGCTTVKREMLAAIIFGGFENITIWLRFNLAISLKESVWGSIFFQLVTTNFCEIDYFSNFANKSSPIIDRFTVSEYYALNIKTYIDYVRENGQETVDSWLRIYEAR